jgi:CubicO group peptidase (beta-lactamase class C family)
VFSKIDKMSKNLLPAKEENRASIFNWKTSPYNRWAFHHVKSLIPTVPVENDIHHVNAPKFASKFIKGFTLKSLLKATATDAIVVLHNGQIVYESYANGNNEHTPHILMSATKAIVGLIAGILEHNGDIDLCSPVSAYIPATIGTLYQNVTLRQLLDMRAGIELDQAQQKSYDIATNWEALSEGDNPTDLHEFFLTLKHGGKLQNDAFNYVSANTDLLGWAIENATGRTFNSLISEMLWKPMGAENKAYLTVDKNGNARTSGGLCATARDFAQIGQLILDGGTRHSKQVIPASLISDIVNNGNLDAWKNGQWGKVFAPISKNMCYRNGWYIMNDQPKILFAMGIYGQNLFIDQTNNIVIAKFSSWKNATDYQALPLTHLMVKTIRELIVK